MSIELLRSLFADYNDRHSSFQIDHFIIGESGETLYGMYQQALREVSARICSSKDGSVSPTQQIECARFLAIAIAIKRQLGEITPERRDELDRDMWLARFKRMAALDLLAEHYITRGTWRVILNTPKAFRAELVDTMLNRPEELKNWLLGSDSPWHLIESKPDEDEALRLLENVPRLLHVDGCANGANNGAGRLFRLAQEPREAIRKDRHGN